MLLAFSRSLDVALLRQSLSVLPVVELISGMPKEAAPDFKMASDSSALLSIASSTALRVSRYENGGAARSSRWALGRA